MPSISSDFILPGCSTAPFEREFQFTQVYRQNLVEHPAIREARCLQIMYPALFRAIRPGDLFAGRLTGEATYGAVGFGLEQASGGPIYYCHLDQIQPQLDDPATSPELSKKLQELLDFWSTEATIRGRLVNRLPADVLRATTNPIADMEGRLAGGTLDYGKLLRLGLPGLLDEIEAGRLRAMQTGGDVQLFDGFRMAVELLMTVCREYARHARIVAAATPDTAWRVELETIAAVLDRLTHNRPETLREAMQLVWLYTLISGVVNYGRLDVYLGDYYARDIDAGVLTEAQALALLQSLWKLIADRKIVFNSRVVVGGRGRPNAANADRFALAAMEATRTVEETEPQLTLRFYSGQNPALMQKALEVIGAGRIYPMLYNDDVNVPSVQNAFGVSVTEAESYFPYGCGEYALEHLSFGSPNCGFNLLKALEVTLHNGTDRLTGQPLGLAQGGLERYVTFDDLLAAYKEQVEHHARMLFRRHALEVQVEAESAAFLYLSLLFSDCLERGRAILNGGAVYAGGILEVYGMINAADSLTAIRQLVYEEHRFTLAQVVTMLDANFVGYERERQLFLQAPKYGNDQPAADEMVQYVSDHIARFTYGLKTEIGLDYTLIVVINNLGNVDLGHSTAASADGRLDGKPLANGNTPTAGMDKNGITAFLNSIVKPDPHYHAGYVQNMKLSGSMFAPVDLPKTEALLDTYFACGGTQAMITVLNRGDLENALRHPEQYRNLIVRVGGFSARFVELAPDLQQDILNRTLY